MQALMLLLCMCLRRGWHGVKSRGSSSGDRAPDLPRGCGPEIKARIWANLGMLEPYPAQVGNFAALSHESHTFGEAFESALSLYPATHPCFCGQPRLYDLYPSTARSLIQNVSATRA